MKIYVSDKDIKENDLLDTESCDIVLTKYREDFWEEEIYPEIQSLEQHEAEIRKPLEDEIEMLKLENKNIQNAIKLVDEAKYTAQQDDINFFVEQERQKVIAELETWLEFQNENAYVDDYGCYCEIVKYANLQQKLNEMKEV